MARPIAPARLIVASHNEGKVREIAALLAPLGIEAVGAAACGLAEPEETGTSFEANAALKARAAATASGEPALADDSGLVVPALDGAPGIYSARWAGPGKDFRVAMDRIEAELAARGLEIAGAAAHFVCALSLAWPDGLCETVEGRVDGRLAWPPRGGHGPVRVARQVRRDFEAHEAIAALRGLVDPQQDVARGSDVGDRQRLERLLGVLAVGEERRDLVVVGIAAGNGPVEDRRI